MIAKTFAPFRGVKPFAIMEWGAASSCASSCHAVDRPSRVRAADLPAERPEKPAAATPAGPGHAGWTRIACVRGTIPGPRFVTSDQAPNVRSGLRSAEEDGDKTETMSADSDTTRSAADDVAAAPLDLLLGDAATGMLRRFNPGGSGLRLAAALAAKPRLVAGRGGQLAGELARIAVGRSQVQPSRRDRRFADPGWTGNPLLRRTMQAYLATAESVEGVVADVSLDEADSERVGFVLTNLIDALAPSNNPLLNPAAVKAAIDTGGGSAVTGLRHFLSDMAVAPRVPTMVEPDAFEVGVDLAVTPGSVVLRNPVFELIQYRPVTPTVRHVPLVIVPPVINKFYVMDLAPGRSMVEYLVGQGLQVFMISWRNPDARYAKWDANTYGQAILDAMDAAERITGSEQTVLAGACSGGIIAAMVAAHLANSGQQDRLAAFTLMVTVLDQAHAGLASAVIDERTAKLAEASSRARGYLDGRSLAEVFAWLRPNDLIWNYWVNNYLLGKKPAPFDILFWNADTTRMTAGLHRDFLELGAANALVEPGGATMLGSPVDLAAVDRDSYIVAGITDHICPWQSCYRTTQLLGGRPRFLLSTSGHVAAMVNPPGHEKARYQMAKECPEDPQEWLRRAETLHGSWWPDYAAWLTERCGEERAAPADLGGGGLAPVGAAPGTYVYDH
jgi:polyhydroxyalkanoate synthase